MSERPRGVSNTEHMNGIAATEAELRATTCSADEREERWMLRPAEHSFLYNKLE